MGGRMAGNEGGMPGFSGDAFGMGRGLLLGSIGPAGWADPVGGL